MIIDYRSRESGVYKPGDSIRLYDGNVGAFIVDWFFADDATGRYGIYLRDSGGSFYKDRKGKFVRKWKHGSIRFFAVESS